MSGIAVVALAVLAFAAPADAASFSFSTGNPDGKVGLGSRPASSGVAEIEASDDFVLTDSTSLDGASFTGLLPSAAPLSSIQQVRVAIYRVFPVDSDVGRTSGSPLFSTSLVPTRVNSPSDADFRVRDSADGGLTFVGSILNGSFSALNSVLNGINPKPNQTTGGDGFVSGEEVKFTVQFTPKLALPADHYFFVPQVKLASGDFYWLSAPKPIVAPGTPFPNGATDLQAWIRNAALDPDWLRVGTDIVGSGTFNGTFSLSGATCEPISLSPANLPGATAGQAYSTSITASGGVAPYSFGKTGALPAGVALDPGGSLAGTPAEPGSFPITVSAADANGCTGSADFTLAVGPAASDAAPLEPISPITPSPSPLAAPSITSYRLSPKAFRAAKRGATLARHRRPHVGTTVSYVDSQAATTTFTVLKRVTRHRRVRYVRAGSFAHVDKAGKVRVRFSGRMHRHKLKPGRYRLTLTPKANGARGKTVTLTFRIVS